MYPIQDLLRPIMQAIGTAVKELQQNAVGLAVAGECIGLVGIHMHGQGEVLMYANHHIRIDQGPVVALGDDKDRIVVLYVKQDRFLRGHVDMAFCDDDAFL